MLNENFPSRNEDSSHDANTTKNDGGTAKFEWAVHDQDSLYNSIDELKEFARDAVLCELFGRQTQDSNLFGEADERFDELCKSVEPSIEHDEKKLRQRISRQPKELHDEIDDIATCRMVNHRGASYIIGIFVGAMAADPSGRTLESLGKAFERYQLAQPRHHELRMMIEEKRMGRAATQRKRRTRKALRRG